MLCGGSWLLLVLLNAGCGVWGCLTGCTCSKTSYSCYRFHSGEIDAAIFSEYPRLNQIVLMGSKLETLPVGLFAGLSELQELKMPNNAFATLPAGVFAGLTRLSRVTLSYNALQSLPDGLFRDATNLQTLSLDNNLLTSLPADLFSNAALRVVDVSDNRLLVLPPGLLTGLGTLQSASFARNAISALAPGALHGLKNLQFLNLAENRITSIPASSFSSTPKLHTLYLYRNEICSYGFATSPEAIHALIIAEVKHHVDVIVQPQASRCPEPLASGPSSPAPPRPHWKVTDRAYSQSQFSQPLSTRDSMSVPESSVHANVSGGASEPIRNLQAHWQPGRPGDSEGFKLDLEQSENADMYHKADAMISSRSFQMFLSLFVLVHIILMLMCCCATRRYHGARLRCATSKRSECSV
jgi:hypothetical protein